MQIRRRPQHPPADVELGEVVHGPAILAQGVDAVAGLRYVVAEADGPQLSPAGTVRMTSTAQERHCACEAAMAALRERPTVRLDEAENALTLDSLDDLKSLVLLLPLR